VAKEANSKYIHDARARLIAATTMDRYVFVFVTVGISILKLQRWNDPSALGASGKNYSCHF
jgi:hypothetical protein